LLEQAIAIDANYGQAQALLATTICSACISAGWTLRQRRRSPSGRACSRTADSEDAWAHTRWALFLGRAG